jgi:DNA-binding LytR/AlgR family response regulator
MSQIKIFILEDEILVAKDLALRLSKMNYEVVSITNSIAEALAALQAEKHDIAILDIHLNDQIDGIGLAHKINQFWPMPIIFLTSFSDSTTLERAKDCRPAAYMLKPFNDRELAISIELAIANYAQKVFASNIISNQPSTNREEEAYHLNESLFLRKKDRFERVHFEDILWAEAQSNYTRIISTEEKFVMAITLQNVADQLVAPYFVRTHRSFVVNLKKVESLEGNMLYIGGNAIPVSKSKKELIFNRFRKL